MSLFLPVRTKGSAAITICPRCQQKMYVDERRQDPNTKVWMHADCCDLYDPWKLPARQPDNIVVQFPRKDEDLTP